MDVEKDLKVQVTNPNSMAQNGPSFRGLSANGVQEGFPTPLRWDVEKKYKHPLENTSTWPGTLQSDCLGR